MILQYAISVFITQLVFIGARTWNVRCIATQNMTGALISGTIVHLSWLVSIAIGAVSINEILTNFNLSYLPVVACSLLGGLIGTYIGLKEKKKKC